MLWFCLRILNVYGNCSVYECARPDPYIYVSSFPRHVHTSDVTCLFTNTNISVTGAFTELHYVITYLTRLNFIQFKYVFWGGILWEMSLRGFGCRVLGKGVPHGVTDFTVEFLGEGVPQGVTYFTVEFLWGGDTLNSRSIVESTAISFTSFKISKRNVKFLSSIR